MNSNEHGIVAIVMEKDKFLLLEDGRDLMKGYWAPPHGRCENSDLTEQNGVKREVLEETGLEIEPAKKLWSTAADTKVKTVSFWLVKLVGSLDNLVVDPSETSAYGWFSLEEALKMKLYPGTKNFLDKVATGEIHLDT